jgi:hypothetical protein
MIIRLGLEGTMVTRTCVHCGQVHGLDEICRQTISRRKFIFLSGAAFAVANLDPSALIAPVERAGLVFDLAEANDILKRMYIGPIREMLNQSSILATQLLQETGDVWIPGQPKEIPVRIKGSAAISEYRKLLRKSRT